MERSTIDLIAENAVLESEIQRLKDLVPQVTPYVGKLPATWQDFEALPDPWRRQLYREHQGEMEDLRTQEKLLLAHREEDARQARVAQALGDLPFRNVDEFNALAPEARRDFMRTMTPRQRQVLVDGDDPSMGGFL